MRSLPLILALLTLTATAPLVAAQAPASPVAAWGPDAEGAWWLQFDVARDVAGNATLRFDVLRSDADVVHATRELGVRALGAGTTRLNLSFLPAEGPGDYAVSLVVDGVASDALSFHAEGSAGAGASLAFDVPDEPTWLNLTADTVNADGKLKNPGDDVITRATVRDNNGLAELDGVRWSVDGPAFHDEGMLALPDAVNASLEHRWHASPLPNATYRVVLAATKNGTSVAAVTRTFVAKDVPATLVPFALPDVVPDADVAMPLDVTLADRNGAPAEGTLEARLYKGTARAESLNLSASFGAGNTTSTLAGSPRGSADGAGLTAYPLVLRVPFATPAGAYRLALYLNGTSLGGASFNVSALPTLADLAATPEGDVLAVNATGTGDGVLVVEVRDGALASRVESPFHGNATARVPAPSANRTLTWNATLYARAGGAALAWREGAWSRAAPDLVARLERGLPRLPASWSVEAQGWDLAHANATLALARWDGAAEPNLTASFDGARLVVNGPSTLAPGRYAAILHLRFPNGTEGEARVEFEAGPWVRIAVGAPTVSARSATLPVSNEGGLAVRKLVAEVDGNATLALVVGNTTYAPRVANGRFVFEGFALAPGEVATLAARLPDGPLASGTRGVAVRLVAMAGGA